MLALLNTKLRQQLENKIEECQLKLFIEHKKSLDDVITNNGLKTTFKKPRKK